MATTPAWYEQTLASQLRMTTQTWEKLEELGIDENSRLRLYFFYDAPHQQGAEALVACLCAATDYDARASSQKAGMVRQADLGRGRPEPADRAVVGHPRRLDGLDGCRGRQVRRLQV